MGCVDGMVGCDRSGMGRHVGDIGGIWGGIWGGMWGGNMDRSRPKGYEVRSLNVSLVSGSRLFFFFFFLGLGSGSG